MHHLRLYAQEHGNQSEEDILASEDFKSHILAAMNEKAQASGLTSLERVKALHLTREPFSVENDLMTPTFKVKRNLAKKRYQAEIDQMYA